MESDVWECALRTVITDAAIDQGLVVLDDAAGGPVSAVGNGPGT